VLAGGSLLKVTASVGDHAGIWSLAAENPQVSNTARPGAPGQLYPTGSSYGFPPGFHCGVKSLLASQLTGPIIEPMALSRCSQSILSMVSVGW
jgi:hypothetical protein